MVKKWCSEKQFQAYVMKKLAEDTFSFIYYTSVV
jgi:hypothetical protein